MTALVQLTVRRTVLNGHVLPVTSQYWLTSRQATIIRANVKNIYRRRVCRQFESEAPAAEEMLDRVDIQQRTVQYTL